MLGSFTLARQVYLRVNQHLHGGGYNSRYGFFLKGRHKRSSCDPDCKAQGKDEDLFIPLCLYATGAVIQD